MQKERKRSIAVIAVALTMLALTFMLYSRFTPAVSDFSFYWIAAKLTLEGRNPYSPAQALDLQNQLSFHSQGKLVMLNPPWILPLIAGFGLMSYATAQSLLLFLNLGLLFVSVRWLWALYGGGQPPWIGWIITAMFLPVPVVLASGQIGPLVLFGLAAYLWLEAKHEFLAGVSLFCAAVKPHLVFLVWIALGLRAVSQQRWKAIAGLLIALAAASFFALLLDPQVFQQYAGLFRGNELANSETPTLGGLMRHLSGLVVMQYVPAALALLWFAIEWKRWRFHWDWKHRLPGLLLVSLAGASYAWFFDQVVLLPAVFYAAVLALRMRRGTLLAVSGYLAINAGVLLLLLNHRTFFWYSWTAVGWLALYAVIVNMARESPAAPGL